MGWSSSISWGYSTHLASNPILAKYTNDTRTTKLIKSFYMYLATGKGFFSEGTDVTGDGSSINFYVSINNVKSSTATVTAVSTPKLNSSTGNYYADKSNCTKTIVTFATGIEVAAGASVSVIGTYNENLRHAGDGNIGQVLVAQKDDEYFGGEVVDAVKYYTVSYNANGGTRAPGSQTKTGGTPLTLTSSKPSRTGYTFKYWNTNSAGTGTTYYPEGTYSTDANVTLYAVWQPNTAKVTFAKNDGSGDTVAETFTYDVSNQKFGYNPDGTCKYPMTGQFGAWDRTGYTLLGWSTSATATTATYSVYSGVTNDWINSNTSGVTLYAVWKVNSYTISFDGNGVDLAEDEEGRFDLETYDYGESFIISEYVPENSGYTFQYWSKNKDGSGGKYYPGDIYTLTDDYDVILYAIWSSGSYTVTFDLKGGTRTGGGLTVQTVQSGGSATPPTVIKNGKSFQGWLGSYTNVTTNRTIVALWDSAPLWIYKNGQWEQLK